MLRQSLLAPLTDEALRRAFIGASAIALGSGPVGVFLMLRRMALMGDTMTHAILPGVAVGFLIAGVDSVPEEGTLSPAALIERADRALYSAKSRGRNRIEMWESAFPQSDVAH